MASLPSVLDTDRPVILPPSKAFKKGITSGRAQPPAYMDVDIRPRFKPAGTQARSDSGGNARTFLELPYEIREKIYHHYLHRPLQCCEDCRMGPSMPIMVTEYFPPSMRLDTFEPALSRSCSKIREELLPIFYMGQRFQFIIHEWHLVCVLGAWRKMLKEEHALSVQKMTFWLSGNDGWRVARTFLEFMDTNFPNCKFIFTGATQSKAVAFQKSCEIGQALRTCGAGWDSVEENLERVAMVLHAGGFTNEWPEDEDDGLEVDDSEDDD